VLAFRELRPSASSDEWADFALAVASGAWRDGFSLGVEWRERIGEPAPFDEAVLDEEERRRRLWTAPGVRAQGDPLLDVPPEHREEVLREIEFAQGYGGFRFVDAETGRRIFPPAAVPAEEVEPDGEQAGEGEEGEGGG
jgi:hypothetical protein